MNKYQIRINHTGIHSEGENKTRGKVAFKTRETHWLNTELPSLILMSVDSSFHEGLNGDIKIGALLSVIKENTRGNVSILLADTAHLQAYKLKYKNKALEKCVQSCSFLVNRFGSYFEGCPLLYWSSFIDQNEQFAKLRAQVQHLYLTDKCFQELLHVDAETAYSEKRSKEYPDKRLFIESTKADIIEQSACILVLSTEGYRYQFYPGAPYASIQYVNHTLLPPEKQVYWIDVFLSIEKKTAYEEAIS